MLADYLDPPTERTLAGLKCPSALIGFLRRFHPKLTIEKYGRRAGSIGWSGIVMLVYNAEQHVALMERVTRVSCAGG